MAVSDTIWYIYAVQCDNGSVYIGQTIRLHDRWRLHLTGKGAEWTRKYKPVYFYEIDQCSSIKEALLREKEWKTSSGRRKIRKLITGILNGDLSSGMERISAEDLLKDSVKQKDCGR
jgi:putative endonuclease